MKAKEYAQQILQQCLDVPGDEEARVEHELTVIATVASEIVDDTLARTKHMAKIESKVSAFRESLTKWKAIVKAVKQERPDFPITDNAIGVVLATTDIRLYERLMTKKVFLGYELSPSERKDLDAHTQRQQAYQSCGMRVDAVATMHSLYMLGLAFQRSQQGGTK